MEKQQVARNPMEQIDLLEGLIDQMNKTTAQASVAIDKALTFVDASNRRIDEMEGKDALVGTGCSLNVD
jgi:hypothetical protein